MRPVEHHHRGISSVPSEPPSQSSQWVHVFEDLAYFPLGFLAGEE